MFHFALGTHTVKREHHTVRFRWHGAQISSLLEKNLKAQGQLFFPCCLLSVIRSHDGRQGRYATFRRSEVMLPSEVSSEQQRQQQCEGAIKAIEGVHCRFAASATALQKVRRERLRRDRRNFSLVAPLMPL